MNSNIQTKDEKSIPARSWWEEGYILNYSIRSGILVLMQMRVSVSDLCRRDRERAGERDKTKERTKHPAHMKKSSKIN